MIHFQVHTEEMEKQAESDLLHLICATYKVCLSWCIGVTTYMPAGYSSQIMISVYWHHSPLILYFTGSKTQCLWEFSAYNKPEKPAALKVMSAAGTPPCSCQGHTPLHWAHGQSQPPVTHMSRPGYRIEWWAFTNRSTEIHSYIIVHRQNTVPSFFGICT